jgi:hypothetical protein
LFEVLAWASSPQSNGWLVYYGDVKPQPDETSSTDWRPPQYFSYRPDLENYWRGKILPDCSGIDPLSIERVTEDDDPVPLANKEK